MEIWGATTAPVVVELGTLDLALCVAYLASVLVVGLFFTFKEQRARERLRVTRLHHQALKDAGARDPTRLDASHNHKPAKNDHVLEEYYLGGRRIPWYALAVADVSSYIDISGTMINTALIYALGVKGMYIEIRGGLCLFLAFQLAYTGKLSRRCPVKTRGEWEILHRVCQAARMGWAAVGVLGGGVANGGSDAVHYRVRLLHRRVYRRVPEPVHFHIVRYCRDYGFYGAAPRPVLGVLTAKIGAG
ncbi:hypothetical protein ON010_g15939 [Phytophthora cinnamomi]|nr:hypothetical protein ON010_g15939 [Phytophthora cinnamomi]